AWSEGTAPKQDWTTGRAREPAADHHAHHGKGGSSPAPAETTPNYPLDDVVKYAAALRIAPPVLIQRPGATRAWTVRGDSQSRPLRREITLAANDGAVLGDQGFAQRKLLDRVIGVGISAHEGQLFGL